IAEMPLETFCGDALCVDIRDYPGGHDVTAAEVEKAVADSGEEVREGDILLFCSDHYNRTAGTQAFLDGFNGISAEAVHWMADRGVKIFGVETISPDLVYITDEYPTHRACAERRLTHYENLNNLKDVVNRRLQFYGFPLRVEPAYGSPVRAVGIVGDSEAAEIEFRILGPVEVHADGRPVALGGARQRAVLALLLTRANEVVSVDALIEELWSGEAPRTATNTLQYYVSQLRKALGNDRIATRAP